MKEQLITLKTAKLAKSKGFNEICEYSYEGEILSKTFRSWKNSEDDLEYAVCTQSLLQKWLRETYNMHINISNIALINSVKNDGSYNYSIFKPSDKTNDKGLNYEEMLESALQKALELI